MCFNGFTLFRVHTSMTSFNLVMEVLQKWFVILDLKNKCVWVCACVCVLLKKVWERITSPLASNWSLQSIFNPPLTRILQWSPRLHYHLGRGGVEEIFYFSLHSFPEILNWQPAGWICPQTCFIWQSFKKFHANILIGRFHILICIFGLSWEIRR